jgi:tetrapyrrole methylase family protein / MazG family protein
MARIVIVGLGPGDDSLVTVATLAVIQRIPHRYLRTAQHPSAHLVPDATTFDHVYDGASSFADVYATIADELITAAHHHGEVLYAVPGSPLVLERTVAHLREQSDVEIELHSAVSFLDEVWRVLNLDPVETGVTLIDGHTFTESAAGVTGPMLVAHTHANWVLSDIKLSIDDPDPATPVIVLHHVGLPDERIEHTTWSEMDRVLDADHLTSLYIPSISTPVAAEMVRFHQLARTLRDQCPWDMEQTHHSLVRYLIEETYEVVDAIEKLNADDPSTDDDLIEELGDLLYQVEFHAAIAEEQGRFTMADVARSVHDKLVSRHPHVFGDVEVSSSSEVESNWEAIKRAEKPERTGIFDGVVFGAPSLQLASKMQNRAAKVGFDWPDVNGPLAKISEEAGEVRQALLTGDSDATMAEVGDLLFAVVNVARHLDVDPESALRIAVNKFRSRVESVERLASEKGLLMKEMSLEQLDELWEVVKQHPTH